MEKKKVINYLLGMVWKSRVVSVLTGCVNLGKPSLGLFWKCQ